MMKILPYLRFLWAILIVVNFADSVGTYTLPEIVLGGMVILTFILYCVVMGIQELRSEQIVHAGFFYAFGITFQIILFCLGLFLYKLLLGFEDQILNLIYLVLWLIGLFVFIVLDIKRVLTD